MSRVAIKDSVSSAETQWGMPWNDLVRSLRPTSSEKKKLKSIAVAVEDTLKESNVAPTRLEIGGLFGCDAMTRGDLSLELYAIYDDFKAENYFDTHLAPLTEVISDMRPRLASVEQRGYAISFVIEDILISLYAAGELPSGPAQLAHPPTAPSASHPTDARAVHVETSCAVLRTAALKIQPPLFKDMVRIARKWLTSVEFLSSTDKPSDYLLQLLVLAAVRSSPSQPPSAELYEEIMRKFFSLATSSCAKSGAVAYVDASMPPLFLWWPFYYDRHVVDHCVAASLLSTADPLAETPLVLVDIAAPFINVARSLSDWSELRRASREALYQFERRDAIQSIQDRLQALTDGFQETVETLQSRVDKLQHIEDSPRRWIGTIQFSNMHTDSEKWVKVMDVNLRTIVWRVNARAAPKEGIGYSKMVDLSLQMVGAPLERAIDVDVLFRTSTVYLTFSKENDHVFVAKRSEIVLNRDYPLQITVVA